MSRLFRLFSMGCALALLALVIPVGLGGAVQVTHDSGAFAPGAQVAAADWTEMPNLLTPTTAPAGSDAVDNGVSCVNADFCMGVGDPAFVLHAPPYAELWNGTTWAELPLPTIPGAPGGNVQLAGVSCVTTQFCIAVGNAVINKAPAAPLIEQWDGSAWTVVQDSGSDTTELEDVSCLGVDFCMATGQIGSDTLSVFVEQWNGTAWFPTTLADPAGTTGAFALGVSCTTLTLCMVVGAAGTAQSGGAYVASWDGTNWSPITLTNSNLDTILQSVSCAGVSFCVAVGTGGPNGNHTIVDSWNGASWTQDTVPALPAQGKLFGVSCISTSACTAVGNYVSSDGSADTLVFTWNGLAWSQPTDTANAAGSPQTYFTDVSCLPDWACVAVGAFQDSNGDMLPFDASAPIDRPGYRFVAADGGVFGYGAPFFGSLGGTPLNAPIVGMATMPAGDGYYLVASDGGVFGYGSAQFFGSLGGVHLNRPIVGIAVTADGAGYWLVASDGGVFAFGDAQFLGSMGGTPLNSPIVGMAATPNGDGYYEVASDGGVFAFPTQGGPSFEGSIGGTPLNRPIVGMAVDAAGQYYLVASDGGVFAFPAANGAPFYGSAGSLGLARPVIGMVAVSGGYYLAASDGGVFAYPTVNGPPFLGSMGGQLLAKPIVGISS